MDLTQKKCVACEGDMPPLNAVEAGVLLKQIPGWELDPEAQSVARSFTLKNFSEALAFVLRVGDIAETEGHHPDISFGWGYARITLTTHAIKGLSENDFIVAAKINALAAQ